MAIRDDVIDSQVGERKEAREDNRRVKLRLKAKGGVLIYIRFMLIKTCICP